MWSAPAGRLVGFGRETDSLVTVDGAGVNFWHPNTAYLRRVARGDEAGRSGWVTRSANGRRIAVSSGRTTVFDARTGAVVMSVAAQAAGPNGLALSGDGRTLVMRHGRGALSVWDARLRVLQRRIECGGGPGSVAITQDGRVVAAPMRRRDAATGVGVQTWDVGTGEPLSVYAGHTDAVRAIKFTAHGRRMLTASNDTTVRLWDVKTAAVIRVFQGHSANVRSLALDGAERVVAAGADDSRVILWNVATGAEIARLKHGRAPVYSLALSPDASLLATDSQGVRVWDVARGEPTSFPLTPATGLSLVRVSPDGSRAVTASQEGRLMLWDTLGGGWIRAFAPPVGSDARPFCRFSADSRSFLVYHRDGSAALYDSRDGSVRLAFDVDPAAGAWPTVTPDLRTMATAAGGARATVSLWNTATGVRIGRYLAGVESIYRATLGPHGTSIAAHAGGVIHVWRTSSTTPTAVIPDDARVGSLVHVSDDGAWLIGQSGDELTLWDVAAGAAAERVSFTHGDPQRGYRRTLTAGEGEHVAIISVAGEAYVWSRSRPTRLAATTVAPNGPAGFRSDGRMVRSHTGLDSDVEAFSLSAMEAYGPHPTALATAPHGIVLVRGAGPIRGPGLDVWRATP